jgi:hypothetical protein
MFFGLPTGRAVYRQEVVIFSFFVGQNVGQTLGYGIGIAIEFVRHLPKNELKLMPYLYNRKKWTLRFEPTTSAPSNFLRQLSLYLPHLKGLLLKRTITTVSQNLK